MGTQQALTTKQLETLIIIRAIEQYIVEEDINSKFDDIFEKISWDSAGIRDTEVEEICKVLERFGYIGNNKRLTLDGKQCAELEIDRLSAEVKERNAKENKPKEKNGFTLFGNLITFNLTGIKTGDFGKVEISSEIVQSIVNWVKKQMQSIKN